MIDQPENDTDSPGTTETTPLSPSSPVRRMVDTRDKATQATLSKFYCQIARNLSTSRKLLPIISAIRHGCLAGKHSEMFEIYENELCNEDESFLTDRFGQFGTDLDVLEFFFKELWTKPVDALSQKQKERAISQAHFALRGEGRIDEAIKQLDEGTGMPIRVWDQGVVRYSNKSQLLLLRGRVNEAIDSAQEALNGCRKVPTVERLTYLVDLADAFHHSGNLDAASEHFDDAQGIQKKLQPLSPTLYSVPGYRYCDLLLSQGGEHIQEAMDYADKAYSAAGTGLILEKGLFNLIRGRARYLTTGKGEGFLNAAVEQLGKAGSMVHYVSALVARADSEDITLALEFAKNFGMKLREIDCYVQKVHRAVGERDFHNARRLGTRALDMMEETGYKRRAAEVRELLDSGRRKSHPVSIATPKRASEAGKQIAPSQDEPPPLCELKMMILRGILLCAHRGECTVPFHQEDLIKHLRTKEVTKHKATIVRALTWLIAKRAVQAHQEGKFVNYTLTPKYLALTKKLIEKGIIPARATARQHR